MGRPSLFSLPLLGFALGASVIASPAFGQAKAAPRPEVLAPKKEEAARPSAPSANRPISSSVAAQLAAVAPKYTPPPPKPEPSEEEEIDARDVDKPRNNIIRLPKYIVQEAKPPVFNERAIHTKEGLTDLALRRYITDIDRALNRFALPLFSGWSPGGGSALERRAMAMYAEQERLDNLSDMSDAAATVGKSDAAQGTYILRESQKTYLRNNDIGWNPGVGSARR